MNSLELIKKHYKEGSKLYELLVAHSKAVAQKALDVAFRVSELNPDLRLIAEGCMLHDIGIKFCNAKDIYCIGKFPYLAHGYLGRKLVEEEGYPLLALICERHTGVGISLIEIKKDNLPLPHRDMLPISIEEQIISFSDLFFSKKPELLGKELSKDQIKKSLSKFGILKIKKFEKWCKLFKEP